MQVFITGDRSASPTLAGFCALELLRAAGRGDTVYTGDNGGAEAFVRQIANDTGFPVQVIESPRTADGAYVDWDKRHAALRDETDMRVVLIHPDPMSSRIGRSLLQAFGDDAEDRVQFVTQFSALAEAPQD